uniref:Uncharacterized protein n=1 Tax=Alexandrium andersonii TaxID=327968 RepID=A0A7S2EXY1_9DINO|mmetsp:Transcript_10064/g.22907  ORF Transcript_10064/g.22907 Transcript_10064/m.22907 type:complete len:333 (+) Transcript_10064:39-1037(+)
MRRMKALTIFLLPWLQDLGARALDDGSALLHKDFHVHSPAASARLLPLTPSQAFAELWHRTALRADRHLQTFEVKMEAERKELQALKDYLEKVHSNFGKHSTIFAQLRGLLPGGTPDEEDRAMGAKFLGLLKDEAFSKELLRAFNSAGKSIASYVERTGRSVADLHLKSANSTEENLGVLIGKFFKVQQHIFRTMTEKMDNDLDKVLLVLPSNYSFLADAAGSLLKQLASSTHEHVAHQIKRMTDSNGTEFCGNYDTVLTTEVLPLMNDTLQAVSHLEAFAQSTVPEVMPVVQKLSKQAADISRGALAAVSKESQKWSDQLCSLILAAAPMS